MQGILEVEMQDDAAADEAAASAPAKDEPPRPTSRCAPCFRFDSLVRVSCSEEKPMRVGGHPRLGSCLAAGAHPRLVARMHQVLQFCIC